MSPLKFWGLRHMSIFLTLSSDPWQFICVGRILHYLRIERLFPLYSRYGFSCWCLHGVTTISHHPFSQSPNHWTLQPYFSIPRYPSSTLHIWWIRVGVTTISSLLMGFEFRTRIFFFGSTFVVHGLDVILLTGFNMYEDTLSHMARGFFAPDNREL